MDKKITGYCTGCRACEQLCAHHAIVMKSDKEGFVTACIDEGKCVECGLCSKRCPQNNLIGKSEPIASLAVRDKDDEELAVSASGGAFAAAARVILQHGGIVVGAAYNDDMTVGHIVVERLDDLYKVQSSKYVQSNTMATYSQVKAMLREGREVLYSGTPCQIGGLRAYLRKNFDTLYTMDLICHGVASPKLFAKYLVWLGGKMNGKIIGYDFRDKSCGWGLDYMTKTKTKTKTIALRRLNRFGRHIPEKSESRPQRKHFPRFLCRLKCLSMPSTVRKTANSGARITANTSQTQPHG